MILETLYENDTCLAKTLTTLKFFSYGPPHAIVAMTILLISMKIVEIKTYVDFQRGSFWGVEFGICVGMSSGGFASKN